MDNEAWRKMPDEQFHYWMRKLVELMMDVVREDNAKVLTAVRANRRHRISS